jgi:DNA replication protein DnaC|tara:strand:+ start:370 stop:1224 length:855 start_codon:yes stop_codon:yes gene_type:complete
MKAPSLRIGENDPGYYYDRTVYAGQHGEIRLSRSVESCCSSCPSKGRQPFQYLDENQEPRNCPCFSYRKRISAIYSLFSSSDIPQRYRFKFQDDFLTSNENGETIPGAEYAKNILYGVLHRVIGDHKENRSRTGQKGFYLWGDPGNGKTLLSCIALNELMFHTAIKGKFIDISRGFFQTLRSTFDENSRLHGQSNLIVSQLGKVPYLVIDDFGIQRNTEWEEETLYNLIDERYVEEKLTFITSNKSPDDIKDVAQGRIYSRINEMCFTVHITSPDYRAKDAVSM